MSFAFLLACLTPGDKKRIYARLKRYLAKNEVNIKDQEAIFVLDSRICASCKANLGQLIKNNADRKTITVVDIVNNKKSEVPDFLKVKFIRDSEQDFFNYMTINHSVAIFLENEKIDTIISIKVMSMNESLSFIEAKIK